MTAPPVLAAWGPLAAVACAGGALPWAVGGTVPWAPAAAGALAAGAVAAVRGVDVRRDRAWLAALGMLSLFLLVQALNASHTYVPRDAGLWPRAHAAWLPAGADAASVLRATGLLTVYACVALAARALPSAHAGPALALLVTQALVLGGVAIAQRLARPPASLTGMFVNANHFAAWANLALPLVLYAGARARRAPRGARRSHPGFLCDFVAALLVLAVAISGSRAGLALSVALLLASLGLRGRRTRGLPLLPAALALLLVAGFAWDLARRDFAPGKVRGDLLGARLPVYAATGRMFLRHPVFGTGVGTFHCAFPYYQPAAARYYRHAHNDWLQALAELGLVGCGLAAAALVLFVRVPPTPASAPSGAARGALWLALAGLGLHATVDFPLRNPAVAALAAVYVGLLASRRRDATLRTPRPPGQTAARATPLALLVLVIAAPPSAVARERASVRVEVVPPADLVDAAGSFERHAVRVTLGSAPRAGPAGWRWAPGLRLQTDRLRFDGTTERDLDLLAVGLPVSAFRADAGPWRWMVLLEPALRTDGHAVGSDDASLFALLLATCGAGADLDLTGGLAFGQAFGRARLYPALGLTWRPHAQAVVQLGFPRSEIAWMPGDALRVDCHLLKAGGAWNVEEEGRSLDLSADLWQVGLGVGVAVGSGWWLRAEAGWETARELEWRDREDRRTRSYDIDDAPFARLSVVWNPAPR